jgi:dephospho-CoA kinase
MDGLVRVTRPGHSRPRRLGLTGGIGSGKSTVARRLMHHGAHLVDTDEISRGLTLPGGQAIEALRKHFGPEFVTAQGGLDRDRMRALVFQDPDAKRRLEGILHPLIGQEAAHRAAQAAVDQMRVYDVPLLVESGHWRARVDAILVVDCEPATQIERVRRRSGLDVDAIQRIMDQQAPRLLRLAAADFVLYNDGLSMDGLSSEVDRLWHQWHPPEM